MWANRPGLVEQVGTQTGNFGKESIQCFGNGRPLDRMGEAGVHRLGQQTRDSDGCHEINATAPILGKVGASSAQVSP